MTSLTSREKAIHSIFPWPVARRIIEYDRYSKRIGESFKEELSLHMFKNCENPRYWKYNLNVPISETSGEAFISLAEGNKCAAVLLNKSNQNDTDYKHIWRFMANYYSEIIESIVVAGALEAYLEVLTNPLEPPHTIPFTLRKDGKFVIDDPIVLKSFWFSKLYIKIVQSPHSKATVTSKYVFLTVNLFNGLLPTIHTLQIGDKYFTTKDGVITLV